MIAIKSIFDERDYLQDDRYPARSCCSLRCAKIDGSAPLMGSVRADGLRPTPTHNSLFALLEMCRRR